MELATTAPRILLMGVFYVMLGRLLGGDDGAEFALSGVVAFAASSITILGTCDVTLNDQWSGAYHRLQIGALSPGLVYLCRTLPHAAYGMAASIIVLCVDGPLLGLADRTVELLAVLPLYLVISVTSTMFGLAVAASAVGSQKEVLFGNLAIYLVLLGSAIVTPLGPGLSWIAAVGDFIPYTHGLAAVRSAVDGGPWIREILCEMAVGISWMVFALVLVHYRDRALRRAEPIGLASLNSVVVPFRHSSYGVRRTPR
ncbi:ABC transporter permease [Nocardia abscessus]|uniref:ABC transporter permease n=1 Tax=Nocardia abscessus TaxID=120957 RepID=UPI002456F226|nr:ABC transporter permease [Nocardia abscessus]